MDDHDLSAAYRRTALIGVAMLSTLGIYAVVAFAIASTHDPFEGFASLEDDGLLRTFFFGLTLLQIVSIKIIRTRALRAPESTGHQPIVATPGERSRLLSRLFSVSIVTFALAESIAVYGLVLFLLNGDPMDLYAFLGISFLCFITFFPRHHQWQQWVQRQRMGR